MTIRIPIRTIYNANGDATGLGEFQTGDKLGYTHGGTGLSVLGTAGQTLVVNDSANGLEWGAGFAASDARTAISVTDAGGDGSLAYNNSTGVLTYTGPSASEVRAHFSAAGDLSYNQSTGEFSFDVENVYTQANFDSDFNTSLDAASLGGTGLTYTAGTNTLSITNTGVTAAEYGSASLVPVITVNAQGQITAASTVSVAGVSSTSWDSSTGNLIINTADGGTFNTNVTLDPYDTDDLSEGSTNLYYTDARARAALSASGDLSYNSLTGDFSFTERTDAEVRGLISATDAGGDGSFSYNSSTGAFTYTGPSASEVRAHFSAGTGVAISSGEVSIGQAVGTTDNVTFNNVTVDGTLTSDDITSSNVTATGNVVVQGDLTVNGTTTTINSTTVSVNDKNLLLADSAADATAADGAGITIGGANATLTYASVGDKWVSNKDFDAPNFNSTSDRRLKDNIQVINNALNKVNSINGVTFNWKESGKTSMGVIAQDVEKVAPEVISETNGYKAVNYDGLIGLLIESIKELKQEISDLKQN